MKKKIMAMVLSALMAVSVVFVGAPTTAKADTPSNEKIIYNFLINNMKLNRAAACGVLANIEAESDFNPNLTGDLGTSYGICQWHAGRYDLLKSYCEENGYDYTTIYGQLYYLNAELTTTSYLWNGKTIYKYLTGSEATNNAAGAYNTGYYWCYYYEIPANRAEKAVTRGTRAKEVYWPKYKADDGSSETDDSDPSPATEEKTNPAIKISGAKLPTSVVAGTSYSLTGTISSALKITKVQAKVYNINKKVKTSSSATPNSTSYNLYNSAVDNNLLISKLAPGKYTLEIKASNSSLDKELVEKSFNVIPKKSVITAIKSYSKKTVNVSWYKRTEGINGYQIQYSTSKDFKKHKNVFVKGASKSSTKLTGLKSHTKYYVRIRTYTNYKKGTATKKMPSNWSKVRAVKVK